MRKTMNRARDAERAVRLRALVPPPPGSPLATAVEAATVVVCPFTFAIEHTEALFPLLGTQPKGGTPVYALRLSIAGCFEHFVATTFARRPDCTEPGRYHDEVRFDCAAASSFLPAFHGTLRFRPCSGRTAIVLHGTYVPRFGSPGRALDAIIGRRVAKKIAVDVVGRLRTTLERRWSDELAAFPNRCDLGSGARPRVRST